MRAPSTINQRDRFAHALRRFLETENASAKLLGLATVLALIWANSSLASGYDAVWSTRLPEVLSFGERIPDLKHVINDTLMALFFFVVGLEIKRELVSGELNSWQSAALPAIGAVGGMLVPAALYLAFNAGTPAADGWGIPIATDIAFAVALVSLVGSRVPTGLKVFLLSLAIVDDIGAIAAIAIFYTDKVEIGWLVTLAGVIVVLVAATRLGRLRWWALLPFGVAAWMCALFAGIHPTIAGVLVAFAMSSEDEEGPAIEERLHPWTGLFVLPLFALANAGIRLDAASLADVFTSRLGLGIVVGLVLGKMLGISVFSWVAVKVGLARLPDAVGWVQIVGAAAAAGIGFTVSLFMADVAFDDPELVDAAKLAVFVASLGASVFGILILRSKTPTDDPD